MTAPARILFLALTNDVGANRVVGAMAAAGLDCGVMSPPGFFSAASAFASATFTLPQQRGLWLAMPVVARRLAAVMDSWRPDWIIPLDDMATWQLRSLAVGRRVRADVARLIITSLGDPNGYRAAVSRGDLLDLASRLGVRVPRSRAASSIHEAIAHAAGIGYPLMLKLEHTCGGAGVQRIDDAEQLIGAMQAAGLGTGHAAKKLRTMAKLLVWRAAGLTDLDAAPAGVQACVEGRLALRTVAAVEGRVLAGVNFSAVSVHPEPTGASTVLRPIDHPEMERAAAKIVKALGASGLLSFDFLISPKDNSAALIEMNARPVGSAHLGARIGHDVCGALAAHIAGRPIPTETTASVPDLEIALFPKELERDPASVRLAPGSAVLHDVPWDDAPVIAAYRDWLAARHPTRMAEIDRQLRRPAAAVGAAHPACVDAALMASPHRLAG